jgi:phosphotransacetylase
MPDKKKRTRTIKIAKDILSVKPKISMVSKRSKGKKRKKRTTKIGINLV